MNHRIPYPPEVLDAAKAAGTELITLELDARFQTPRRGSVTYYGHLLTPAERLHANAFYAWLAVHRLSTPPPDELLEREWETGF